MSNKEFTPRYKWAFRIHNQEEADLAKKIALLIGYKWESSCHNDWEVQGYIVNDYDAGLKAIAFFLSVDNEVIIEEWNEELFTAVITASEGDNFVEGEWAYRTAGVDWAPIGFIGKVYKDGYSRSYRDNENVKKSFIPQRWRKPTIEELKSHFLTKTKQTITMDNTKLTVKGSPSLIEAFIKEIEGMDWNPLEYLCRKAAIDAGNISNSSALGEGKKLYSQFSWLPTEGIHFNLPTDWDKALEAFKNFNKAVYKIGDWVTCINGKKSDVSVGWELGKTFQISDIVWYTQGTCAYSKEGTGVYVSCLRLATIEEIKRATEPQEITVKVKYSDGTFDLIVRKDSGVMGTEDGNFKIGDIKDLYSLMVGNRSIGVNTPWSIRFSTVNVGCKKGIPVESIKEIIDTWDKLNK